MVSLSRLPSGVLRVYATVGMGIPEKRALLQEGLDFLRKQELEQERALSTHDKDPFESPPAIAEGGGS